MFRCKQFVIAQDKCAMKVNTDSLILGSWAKVNNATSVLDVGTGTGILALMLAQRTSDNVLIDAIDIDASAAQQAQENAANSPWTHRINVSCSSLQSHNEKGYDVIVSNPPYFDAPHERSNAYTTQSTQRATARQNSALTPSDLFRYCQSHLKSKGWLNCVYPYSIKTQIIKTAAEFGLCAVHIMDVSHGEQREPYLTTYRFQHAHTATPLIVEDTLFIRNKTGEYSAAYKALCKPFYLKF
jgi:tRNA1Val (adenine37-N6)-methyltransferase